MYRRVEKPVHEQPVNILYDGVPLTDQAHMASPTQAQFVSHLVKHYKEQQATLIALKERDVVLPSGPMPYPPNKASYDENMWKMCQLNRDANDSATGLSGDCETRQLLSNDDSATATTTTTTGGATSPKIVTQKVVQLGHNVLERFDMVDVEHPELFRGEDEPKSPYEDYQSTTEEGTQCSTKSNYAHLVILFLAITGILYYCFL